MKNFLFIITSLSFISFDCLQASRRDATLGDFLQNPSLCSYAQGFCFEQYIAAQTGCLKEFEENCLSNKRIDSFNRHSQEIKQKNPSKHKKDWLIKKSDEDKLAMEYMLHVMTPEQKTLLKEISSEESKVWGFDTISKKIKSQEK